MIVIDRELAKREANHTPIRVGLVGAGFMARGIARQIARAVPGMRIAAICNRHADRAVALLEEAGLERSRSVGSVTGLESAVDDGVVAVTDAPEVLCGAQNLDVVFEVTGDVEFGARLALMAFESGTHYVTMSAELDATVGPILRHRADRAGVVYTQADGDQPGVILNLHRFVQGIGIRPVLCGNVKGYLDRHSNPPMLQPWADKWGEDPRMLTSFTDGTKLSCEQASVANATGMRVVQRGMLGPQVPAGSPLEAAPTWYPEAVLRDEKGVVEFVVGAAPSPGIFVIGLEEDGAHRRYLEVYKMGTGPFYVFYTPYHLCHLEAHNAVARAVLFDDATVAPLGGPCVEVVATAKTDLAAGTTLDGIGGYHLYGLCENASTVRSEGLLPIGLAAGARLVRAVPADQVLTVADVTVPAGRVIDELWSEQNERFFGEARVAASPPRAPEVMKAAR